MADQTEVVATETPEEDEKKIRINGFSNISSFMRCKEVHNLEENECVDISISGIPFDLGTSYRPGARFGPRSVREASAQLGSRTPHPWGFHPFDILNVIDYGDCHLKFSKQETIKQTIIDHIINITKNGSIPLTIGGDHYISYPIIAALVEQNKGPISLIHFDAHSDTWEDKNHDSLSHGSMFYKAIKDGLIDVSRSIQIGIRTWNSDPMGIYQIDAEEANNMSSESISKKINEYVGLNKAYLTFDVDCLDPVYAPGTGTPVVGGLTTSHAIGIIRKLAGLNLIGADVVEVSPAYDHSEVTSLAAATLMREILCIIAQTKKDNKTDTS
ncbi:agmatinase [Acidithiobacillus thiooxidans]|uniref:agmatinase n=1 Tax=Acidithiobacillus thiooxidans TaxID=930 RepID=UPI0028661C3C|nr:agmatinase [Acidithiobacillus thiooxidans]MDR7926761.1 agmatinase [Acidithiobacillus thiooxidans]